MSYPASGETHANNGTFLLIPANLSFTGEVVLSASTSASSGGGAAVYPSVTMEGGSMYMDPTPGTLVAELALSVPAVNLLSLIGVTANQSQTFPINVQNFGPTATDAYMKLHFNGVTAACAVVSGLIS